MTPAERNAIGFFALLAAAGAGARAFGIGDPPGARTPSAADRLALQHQLAAVDSAHAERERGRDRGREHKHGRGANRGGGRGRAAPSAPAADRAVATAAPEPAAPVGPVDVNGADSTALERLPGVGPALAHRILADRAAHGAYRSMTELSRVSGIGTALERRLGPRVTFTPGGRPSSGFAPAPDGARASWPAP